MRTLRRLSAPLVALLILSGCDDGTGDSVKDTGSDARRDLDLRADDATDDDAAAADGAAPDGSGDGSADTVTGDGGSSDQSDGRQPPQPATTPAECQEFDPLPWNDRATFDVGTWAVQDTAVSCWSGDNPERSHFFRVSLPPGAGMKVTMRRLSGSYYMWLASADHCTVTDRDACNVWLDVNSASPDDEQTTLYLANDGPEDETYVIRARASRFETPVVGEIEIQTEPVWLADNASCATAAPLPAGTTIVSGHGTRTSMCTAPEESVFYELVLPPMTRAEMTERRIPYGWPSCDCSELRELRNPTLEPDSHIITVGSGVTIGWTQVDLEPHARCESAMPLDDGTPGTGRFDDGGDHRTSCARYGESEHPLFWNLQIPPGQRAVVRGVLNFGDDDMAFMLRVQESCASSECTTSLEGVTDMLTLEVDNPDATPRDVVIAAAVGFAPREGVEITLTVTFEPL